MDKFWKRVYCRKCKNGTHHQIVAKHTIGEDLEGNYFWREEYIIGQCMGCETVTFIKEYDDSSMHFYNYDEGEHMDIEDIQIFPPKPLTKKERHYEMIDFQHLPDLLKTLYKQVVANYELGYYLLSAAGLRMIIEGICNDIPINDGYVTDDITGQIKLKKNGDQVRSDNLNGRINGLVEKRILTEGQTVILHAIRKLGNQTVHKLNNPSDKIILDCLEIVEQTFRNIYELKKYDSLMNKYLKKS